MEQETSSLVPLHERIVVTENGRSFVGAREIMNAAEQFETLVGEHYEALFRFAMSLTRSESDAQDLTQQTFYVWATKGHQLRDASRAKPWLYTTMHRAFLHSRRKHGRYTHHVLEEVAEQLPAVAPSQPDAIDSSQVLVALGAVDEAYQAAVALSYLECYSHKEIAGILEVAVGTVKSRIARGIAQLRGMLFSRLSSPHQRADGAEVPLRFGEPIGKI